MVVPVEPIATQPDFIVQNRRSINFTTNRFNKFKRCFTCKQVGHIANECSTTQYQNYIQSALKNLEFQTKFLMAYDGRWAYQFSISN